MKNWDETAEVKKSEREESEMEEGVVEEIETDMGEVDQRPVITLIPLISPFMTGSGRGVFIG